MFPTHPLSLRASICVVALTLAACASQTGTPPKATPPSQTAAPNPPSEPGAKQAPATQPAALPTPAAEISAVPPVDPAATPVVSLLSRQLHVAKDAITVAQVARAEWPNACLGLAAEGEICAQVITPGYAVSLIVNDQRYDFRTDESGRRIRLAFAPLAEIGEALITWNDSGSFAVLQVGTDHSKVGLRGRPLLAVPLPSSQRARELVGFLSRYAPFRAHTAAGEVVVRGGGSTNATPVECRQVAEWARQVYTESEQGLDQPVVDRAFVWRREGGIAGYCDEVVVSRTGTAMARSCRQPEGEPVATVRLSREELAQLYQWLDTLAPCDWQSDAGGATADALTTSISLAGQGAKALSDSERDQMIAFANALVRRLLTTPDT